jgi:hypothetical protein
MRLTSRRPRVSIRVETPADNAILPFKGVLSSRLKRVIVNGMQRRVFLVISIGPRAVVHLGIDADAVAAALAREQGRSMPRLFQPRSVPSAWIKAAPLINRLAARLPG